MSYKDTAERLQTYVDAGLMSEEEMARQVAKEYELELVDSILGTEL